MNGDSGLGFGLLQCCFSSGLSPVESCAVLLIDKVPDGDPPSSAADGEREDKLRALGDGDAGGLKSSYLKK